MTKGKSQPASNGSCTPTSLLGYRSESADSPLLPHTSSRNCLRAYLLDLASGNPDMSPQPLQGGRPPELCLSPCPTPEGLASREEMAKMLSVQRSPGQPCGSPSLSPSLCGSLSLPLYFPSFLLLNSDFTFLFFLSPLSVLSLTGHIMERAGQSEKTWVQILPLLLSSHMTLGTLPL